MKKSFSRFLHFCFLFAINPIKIYRSIFIQILTSFIIIMLFSMSREIVYNSVKIQYESRGENNFYLYSYQSNPDYEYIDNVLSAWRSDYETSKFESSDITIYKGDLIYNHLFYSGRIIVVDDMNQIGYFGNSNMVFSDYSISGVTISYEKCEEIFGYCDETVIGKSINFLYDEDIAATDSFVINGIYEPVHRKNLIDSPVVIDNDLFIMSRNDFSIHDEKIIADTSYYKISFSRTINYSDYEYLINAVDGSDFSAAGSYFNGMLPYLEIFDIINSFFDSIINSVIVITIILAFIFVFLKYYRDRKNIYIKKICGQTGSSLYFETMISSILFTIVPFAFSIVFSYLFKLIIESLTTIELISYSDLSLLIVKYLCGIILLLLPFSALSLMFRKKIDMQVK